MRLLIIEMLAIAAGILLLAANITYYLSYLGIGRTEYFKSYRPDLQSFLPRMTAMYKAKDVTDSKSRAYFMIYRLTVRLGGVALAATMALKVFTSPDSW